jgi:hypothetical protein
MYAFWQYVKNYTLANPNGQTCRTPGWCSNLQNRFTLSAKSSTAPSSWRNIYTVWPLMLQLPAVLAGCLHKLRYISGVKWCSNTNGPIMWHHISALYMRYKRVLFVSFWFSKAHDYEFVWFVMPSHVNITSSVKNIWGMHLLLWIIQSHNCICARQYSGQMAWTTC